MIPTLFHRVTGHRKSESNMGRNRVVVYPDWCKGCGICAAFCPKKVFAVGQDGKARVVNEEACVNCGFCEPHCPDFAVLVIPGETDQTACTPETVKDPAEQPAAQEVKP
jgi:2-oxoglutarate ferredoxin oxidoreductase subunit delta